MRQGPRTLPIAIAVVVLFVVVAALASMLADRPAAPQSGAQQVAGDVGKIARRVETIRHLRFKQLPKPEIVTPAETRRVQLESVDRETTAAERQALNELLALLALVEPGTDLREVSGAVSGSEVAGYYDTRRERLAIVDGPAAADRLLAELTLAHELGHALDDQAVGLREDAAEGADDAAGAYSALVEGTATSVMQDYTRRYINAGDALGSSVTALGASGSSADIPEYVMSSLLFSYIVGEKFVNRLREVGKGWKLVDYALRSRPPSTTEQVIHPNKYLTNERAVPVALPAVGGFKRVARGTLGEFDTHQILKLGMPAGRAGDAAAGWGGGRYALWSRDGNCDDPCRTQRVLVARWAWDTPRDAAEFNAGLRMYVTDGLSGRAEGPVWRVGDGAAAIADRGLETTLVLAPTPELASRLVAAAKRTPRRTPR